jgi:pimeloyl-ACP methyl ester carboxylesterase
MERWTRRGVIASGLALAGCAVIDRPRLGTVYRPTGAVAQRPPLILIPGAFGSSLRHRQTREEVWPASNQQLLLGTYRELELPIDADSLEPVADGVEAYEIFRAGLGRDFYGQVLDTLEHVGGYRICRAGEPLDEEVRGRLYVHPYDFRLDNARAALGLAALVRQIQADHRDPLLKVDILAHSNGGLLARYFARYGDAALPDQGALVPTYEGARSIRRLLLVGTPNLGTAQPVLSLLRGEEVGLRRIPQEVMATCPGVTQMMPHPSVPWLVDMRGERIDADLYDIATWRQFHWALFDPKVASRTIDRHGGGAAGRRYLGMLREFLAKQLQRGRRFAESLATGPGPDDVRPWVFGGDCELTLARLVVEGVGGMTHARERVEDIAEPVPGVDYEKVMYEPGDTVVTRSSLLGRRTLDVSAPREPPESLRVAHSVFLCERHQQLTGNASFQDNLLNALFSVDVA